MNDEDDDEERIGKKNTNRILYKRMTWWEKMCKCSQNNIKGWLLIEFREEEKKEER